MITIRNISKQWSDFSLKNINLDVEKSEYFVILGPTGAGKTLLLELIAGFYKPDDGKILINGEDVTYDKPEDRDIGFVYQDYSLFPHLTVEENLEFGPQVNDFTEDEVAERVNELMSLLDIHHIADRYPETLSGGEQQKTALARGLILDPDVLLLDEPISALDMPSQEEMREELKNIHKKIETTTIHVTHNREEAAMLGDRIGVLSKGKIVQVGSSSEVFRRPESEFVASFLGIENVFDGFSEVEGEIANINLGEGVEIEAVTDREGEVKACIRPEEIVVYEEPVKSSERNMMKGKIKEVTHLENFVKLKVDAGIEFIVVITRRSFSDMDLEVDREICIGFKASSLHVI